MINLTQFIPLDLTVPMDYVAAISTNQRKEIFVTIIDHV